MNAPSYLSMRGTAPRQRSQWDRTTREEREWLMDRTRMLRHALADARDLRHSFEHLPVLLAAVWHDETISVSERRDILFRIWDECAEADDPQLGAAGARARRMIDDFVRAWVPPGSATGYGRTELAQLNSRRARGPFFDPYTVRPDSDRGAEHTTSMEIGSAPSTH